MRYRNTTKVPAYCQHARRMLGPGQFSQDVPSLYNALRDALDVDRSLGLQLTDKEMEAMQLLLDRHVRLAGFDIAEVQEAIDDPGGLKRMALKRAAERSERMAEYRQFVREDKAFEAMVKGETAPEKVEESRSTGQLDVSAMDVRIGQKPRNLREAMALNAKLDIMRKAAQK